MMMDTSVGKAWMMMMISLLPTTTTNIGRGRKKGASVPSLHNHDTTPLLCSVQERVLYR